MSRRTSAGGNLRASTLINSDQVSGYILLAPSLILFFALILYPLLNTVISSFYRYSLTSRQRAFIGLQNYQALFEDPIFWLALKNNLLILVGSVVLQVGLGLVLAAMLERGVRRFKTLFRTVIFAPMVMSVVAVGLLWQLIYHPSIGIFTKGLKFLHIPVPSEGFLGDPATVVPAIIGAASWQYTGFIMVMLLAGMQAIPHEQYEAARIDGATETQSFWFITVPGIRNIILVATLITMIGAFKVFDIVYVLTGGGPANASQVLGTYLFDNAFTFGKAGYANAIAVMLLLVSLVLGVIQLRFSRQGGS